MLTIAKRKKLCDVPSITTFFARKSRPGKFLCMCRSFLVRTRSLRHLWVFITRENASLARLIILVSSPGVGVLTWCTCPQLAYVSSPGIRVLTWRTCPHLAYMSSHGERVFASN